MPADETKTPGSDTTAEPGATVPKRGTDALELSPTAEKLGPGMDIAKEVLETGAAKNIVMGAKFVILAFVGLGFPYAVYALLTQ